VAGGRDVVVGEVGGAEVQGLGGTHRCYIILDTLTLGIPEGIRTLNNI